MKNFFGFALLIMIICFSSVLSFANSETTYSEEELKTAISYLKEHRDELNITGYSINNNINGLEIMAEKWTSEKEEQFKKLLNINNIEFITDYDSINENDGIVVRLIIKNTDNAIYFRHSPMVDSRVLVSVRGIFELFGYNVMWNNEEKKVIAISDSNKIIFTINDNKVSFINSSGESNIINVDVPPTIINNSLYIPVKFISEISEYSVSWNEDIQMIIIE